MPSGKPVRDLFVERYGPPKAVVAACDAKGRQELERDFAAYHDQFRSELGVAMPREYLVTRCSQRRTLGCSVQAVSSCRPIVTPVPGT